LAFYNAWRFNPITIKLMQKARPEMRRNFTFF
jgi:hypothetical protein